MVVLDIVFLSGSHVEFLGNLLLGTDRRAVKSAIRAWHSLTHYRSLVVKQREHPRLGKGAGSS